MSLVLDVPSLNAADAALWRAVRDMARIRGTVVLIDRWQDGAIVAVGGERQTSEGATMVEAVSLAASRMGLDAGPPTRGGTEGGGP